MGKLINRIPGLRLLISSLPGSTLRRHVESPGKHLAIQQAFSKPCLVNLISKDTHLVFSIYQLPFILTALLHFDVINVVYLTASAFIRSSCHCTF